ncbi:hypothetical protein [Bacillus pumilus]|uniref:hypothetical protein n=1 Tax=Bacillus pumilus TaxID=1408 RepID=UPI001C247849|nr:hypothetical protein [Bacillus pumilus]MBU8573708.1 hypothetical protein [Bacillus pumilus]
MNSYVLNLLKTTQEKIEGLKEQLIELETELLGLEITYKNRYAVIMHVDWKNNSLLLNVDDLYEEWVVFK